MDSVSGTVAPPSGPPAQCSITSPINSAAISRISTRLTCYQVTGYLILDATSPRNLEILEPLCALDTARNLTLFGALNRTVTPMGV